MLEFVIWTACKVYPRQVGSSQDVVLLFACVREIVLQFPVNLLFYWCVGDQHISPCELNIQPVFGGPKYLFYPM